MSVYLHVWKPYPQDRNYTGCVVMSQQARIWRHGRIQYINPNFISILKTFYTGNISLIFKNTVWIVYSKKESNSSVVLWRGTDKELCANNNFSLGAVVFLIVYIYQLKWNMSLLCWTRISWKALLWEKLSSLFCTRTLVQSVQL